MKEYIPRDNVTSKQKRKNKEKSKEILIKNNKKIQIKNILDLISDLKLNLAKKSIDEYILNYGDDCYITHAKGKYFLKINLIQDAKKCFIYNIENNSENKYYSLYELSRIEKTERDYESSIRHLSEILNSNHPDKKHAMLELSKVYNLAEKYEEAEKILIELINNNQDDKYFAYEALIQIKLNLKKYDEVEILIEKIKDNISIWKIKFYKGQMEQQKENYAKASEYFNDIIENGTECKIKSLYELSNIQKQEENYNKAINLLDNILINKNFYYIDALELKIECLIKIGKNEEAYILIEELIDINKKSIDIANLYLGTIEFHKQNYDQALNYYNKVTKKNKRAYRDMIYKKICIYIKKEDYDMAYQLFMELKNVDYTKKYLNKYGILEIYLNKKTNRELLEPVNYVSSLVCEYNKYYVIEHISRHKEINENKLNHTVFYSHIDIYDLYNFALANISNENFYNNSFCDSYIIEYKCVGYNNEKEINSIKVVTLPNTKQIVSIYPYDYDLSIIKENQKNKKKSRIDKFNQKYGMT